jgi:serine/threonine protein kinase
MTELHQESSFVPIFTSTFKSDFLQDSTIPDSDVDDLTESNKIGEGAFAKVHKTFIRSQGKCVAAKVSTNRFGINANELQILKQISAVGNPHVIGFYGVTSAPRRILLFELCEQTLFDFIERFLVARQAVPEWQVRTLLHQIVHGLNWLHEQCDISHCDLKPENILLDAANRVKIGDFGVSTQCNKPRGLFGTSGYMAPEILANSSAYDTRAGDVWALAVIAFQIAYRRDTPFCEKENIELIRAGDFGSFWKKYDADPALVSAAFKHMLEGLLASDPEHRTSLQDLWGDQWFSQPCRDCPHCTSPAVPAEVEQSDTASQVVTTTCEDESHVLTEVTPSQIVTTVQREKRHASLSWDSECARFKRSAFSDCTAAFPSCDCTAAMPSKLN